MITIILTFIGLMISLATCTDVFEIGNKKILKILKISGFLSFGIGVAFLILSFFCPVLSLKYDEMFKEEIAAENIGFEIDNEAADYKFVQYTDPDTKEVKQFKIDSSDELIDSEEEKIVKYGTMGFWADLYKSIWTHGDTIYYKIYLKN